MGRARAENGVGAVDRNAEILYNSRLWSSMQGPVAQVVRAHA
jgi:hypothetical protein